MAAWMAAAVLTGASASAETFYNKEGVVFEGTARRVVSEAAVCNVIEEKYTSEEHERLKGNQGGPLDLWQVDFTVRNESGRQIEYLRATAWLQSEHPPCTNWSGEGPGQGPLMPEPSLLIPTVWSDYYAPIQMPNGMRIGQQQRHSVYLVAFGGQVPRFGEWKIDYRFVARSVEAAVGQGVSAASPARESGPRMGAVQLPQEIQADLYLREAGQAVREGDRAAAREALERVAALQRDHGLELAPEDHYRYASAWEAVGEPERAMESAVRYLQLQGRAAEHYAEVLDLISRARTGRAPPAAAIPDAGPVAPEHTCARRPVGSECWMHLASHPGCYAWNPNLQANESATWSGECGDGLAQGAGSLSFAHDSSVEVCTGLMRDGMMQGHWVIRSADGSGSEGPFVDGKRQGHWVERSEDGDVFEGPYANNEENGSWVLRFADGSVEEGTYVDGEKHGRWVIRRTDGTVEPATYVNGERQQ